MGFGTIYSLAPAISEFEALKKIPHISQIDCLQAVHGKGTQILEYLFGGFGFIFWLSALISLFL
jgi:hypothetical protein